MQALNQKVYASFAYALILTILCFYMTVYTFGVSNMLKNYPNTSIIEMVNEESPRPFVYRALVPVITNSIVAITPQITQEIIGQAAYNLSKSEAMGELIESAKWDGYYTENIRSVYDYYKIVVVFFITFGFLVAYGAALYHLSKIFFPQYKILPYATSLFGLFLVIPFVKSVSKIYDFPVLALYGFCLISLYRRKWAEYLTLFALATLNKESTFLLIAFFSILFRKELKNPPYLHLLIAQCAIFIFIISGLHFIYADNRGANFWHNLVPIIFLSFRDFTSVHMMVLITIFALLTARWNEVPSDLRKSIWLLAGCTFLYYFFGLFREYRIFYECFPGLTVIASYTLFKPLEKA